jgi:MFS transporter, ACS family, D-galactonate transporter
MNPYASPPLDSQPISAGGESSLLVEQPPTKARYIVLAWLCAAAMIAYICRNSIGVAESTIRAELGLTKDQSSYMMLAFFLAYALAQIPTGWLGDRFGSRAMLPVLAIAWSAATAAMGLAAGAGLLILTRVVNGIAQAGLFPCATNTLSKWSPLSRRAFFSGTMGAFMSIGGAVGSALAGVMLVWIGWRWTFASFSILGVFWAMGFVLWFRNRPQEHTGVNDAELALIEHGREKPQKDEEAAGPTPWLAFLTSPATWWICGQQFCRGAGQIFFASWFPTFLQESRGVSVEGSGFLNMLPLIALVLGAFLGGAVSDRVLIVTGSRWLARSGVAGASMVFCAAFVGLAYFIEDPILAVVTISIGTFGSAVGGPCAYTITIDMGGRHVATLFGAMNMIGNLGAMAFIRIVPMFQEWTQSWDAVLLLFAAVYAAAAVCWLMLNPNGTVFEQALLGADKAR